MQSSPDNGLLSLLWFTLAAWTQRARDRHALAQLSEHARRDVGLGPETIEMEISKPIWRA